MATRKKNFLMTALLWAAPIGVGAAASEVVEGFQQSGGSIADRAISAVKNINFVGVALVLVVAGALGLIFGLAKK
jgi:hypothetical protein